MNASFKITKNTIALIAREALNKGALFILLILVGRLLGKEALGRYSLALAISQIFFFGTEMGLNTIMVRDVSKERSLVGKFLVNIGALRIILGIGTLGLIWLTALIIGARDEAATVIYLCAFSSFFINITNIYTSSFRAFEKMELETLIALVKNILFLPVAIWMLFNGFGLIAIFNVFLVSNLVALIAANVVFLNQIGRPRWEFDFGFLKDQLTQTLPLWIGQLFGIAYLKIAPLLLFKLKGEEAVGIYNAGYVIVDGLWILVGCFIYSLFPIISRLCKTSLSEARREYLKGVKFILLIFIPLGAVLILAAPWITQSLYGNKFIEIIPLIRFMVVASVMIALGAHAALTIVALGKQILFPFINGMGLLIVVVLNLLLIPKFSYMGSAYALIITASSALILLMIGLKDFLFPEQKTLYAQRAR